MSGRLCSTDGHRRSSVGCRDGDTAMLRVDKESEVDPSKAN